MGKLKKGLFLVLAFLLISPLAYAEEASETKNWHFQLAPFYLWAVNMEGDVTVGRVTTPLKLEFGEIFDSVESLFTAHFEVWYKRKLGLLTDVSYMKIGDQQTTPLGNLDVDFKNVLAELAAFYRFGKGPHALDALVGVRYTGMEVDVDLQGTPLDINGSQEWLDPIIGARYGWNISKKWSLILRGDIGGFDIGDASDFSWNLAGLIHFQPWKHIGFAGGYRVLDIDYDTGSGNDKFAYDVQMHGPLLGINIIF